MRKVQPVAFLFTYNAGSFEALNKTKAHGRISVSLCFNRDL